MRKSDRNVVPVAGITEPLKLRGKSDAARKFGGIARFVGVVVACVGVSGAILYADLVLHLSDSWLAIIFGVGVVVVLAIEKATAPRVEEDEE